MAVDNSENEKHAERHIPMQHQSDYHFEVIFYGGAAGGGKDFNGLKSSLITFNQPPELKPIAQVKEINFNSVGEIDSLLLKIMDWNGGEPNVIYTSEVGARAWYASRELEKQPSRRSRTRRDRNKKRKH